MKKGLKVLSLVLVVMFILTSIPVSAGFSGAAAAAGLYLDFETAADKDTANGGVSGSNPYYKWLTDDGIGFGVGRNGNAILCFKQKLNAAVPHGSHIGAPAVWRQQRTAVSADFPMLSAPFPAGRPAHLYCFAGWSGQCGTAAPAMHQSASQTNPWSIIITSLGTFHLLDA